MFGTLHVYIPVVLVSVAFAQSSSISRLYVVQQGNRSGYIDREGKLVIPLAFSDADDFSEGLAAVRNQGSEMWGYIDESGKEVIKPISYSYGPRAIYLELLGN